MDDVTKVTEKTAALGETGPDVGAENLIQPGLSVIQSLSRQDLLVVWTEAYGRAPPKGISRRLLQYAAAYHIQAGARGGLSRSVTRALVRAYENEKEKRPADSTPSNRLSPGTRLVREWHGRPHSVDVLESGFLFEGKTYKSLSAIARVITGTRWSGPRFFGL
jgi:hypothetical protein